MHHHTTRTITISTTTAARHHPTTHRRTTAVRNRMRHIHTDHVSTTISVSHPNHHHLQQTRTGTTATTHLHTVVAVQNSSSDRQIAVFRLLAAAVAAAVDHACHKPCKTPKSTVISQTIMAELIETETETVPHMHDEMTIFLLRQGETTNTGEMTCHNL